MNTDYSNLYGWAYGCPRKKREKDCPMNKVEHLSFREKVDWIDGLSEKKKQDITAHHTVCSCKVSACEGVDILKIRIIK